jgi:7-cyano-7-deazaguanine reductase
VVTWLDVEGRLSWSAMASTTLTKLGNPGARADRQLEVFETGDPALRVTLDCAEFTCRCPITGQPDWATITISYVPAGRIVESKSVKLYLETFREEGIFHEHLATTIRDDFVAALDPHSLEVTVNFHSRGGIAISAQSSYDRDAAAR